MRSLAPSWTTCPPIWTMDFSLEPPLHWSQGGRSLFFYFPRTVSSTNHGLSLLLSLIDHSDGREGAEGPRQAGASTRGPRRGELEGGRRPPSCELALKLICEKSHAKAIFGFKTSSEHFRSQNVAKT